MTLSPTPAGPEVRTLELSVQPLTASSIAPIGTVIAAAEDGVPFGPQDAQLDL